ncbi:MAG: BTAD domain-containing putative transcriptional regulator [Trueperaceae bacterium]
MKGDLTSLLHFRLLGMFRLEANGASVAGLESPRVQSLLAYLLLHRQAPLSRQRIAFEFWPDSGEEQARTNLRQLLHYLRRDLPGSQALLDVTPRTLRWHPEAPLSLDVALFEAALSRAEQTDDADDRRRYLTEAIAHYGGELLPGRFEEWLLPIRERLLQSYLDALEQLAELCETAGDHAAAIRHARRLLRNDLLNENAYCRLIGLYARAGDRGRALHVYHSCVGALRRELGVEPGPAVTEAYRALLSATAGSPPITTTSGAQRERLIGRRTAWTQLMESWLAAVGGSRFVWLTGEAGIGKSHLSEAFQRWCREQGNPVSAARCFGPGAELAYAPLIEWLRSEPLQGVLEGLDGNKLSEVARLLPELLTARSDIPYPEPLTEGWQRTRLFERLSEVFTQTRGPRVFVLDDGQWCDGETIAWLGHLARHGLNARQLVLVALRSDELAQDHPLTSLLLGLRSRSLVTEIELGPLSETESAELTKQLTGREAGLNDAALIYREGEGNPLFITELARAGSPASPVHPDDILGTLPPRMQAVLQARLAQLSPTGRLVAELAACIGRDFNVTLLAGAGELDEDDLMRGLDELWRRRIVRELGGDAYDFSHDKLRAAAYAAMSGARRRLMHGRIASLVQSAGAVAPKSPDALIAFHYERADLPVQAAVHFQHAATAAQRLLGNQVAISLLDRALRLVATLPESDESAELELTSRVALGVSLVALLGYAAPEVVENYERAQYLAKRLGRQPDAPILRALAITHVVRGELEEARVLGKELLDSAGRAGDAVLHVEARYVLGVTMFWQGALLPARAHLEEALLRYEPVLQLRHLALYSQDPQVVCLSRLAFLLYCLGYPEEAQSRSEQALHLAEELGHPFSTAYASIWAALLHSLRRDAVGSTVHTDRAVALCRENGIGLWLQLGTILQGWARGEAGDLRSGQLLMQDGMAELRATGAEFVRPYFLTLLAELHGRSGEVERGIALLAEAQAAVEMTGERWSESELNRVRGQLLRALPQPDLPAAEAALARALEIASAQQARTFELRARAALAGPSLGGLSPLERFENARQGKVGVGEQRLGPGDAK